MRPDLGTLTRRTDHPLGQPAPGRPAATAGASPVPTRRSRYRPPTRATRRSATAPRRPAGRRPTDLRRAEPQRRGASRRSGRRRSQKVGRTRGDGASSTSAPSGAAQLFQASLSRFHVAERRLVLVGPRLRPLVVRGGRVELRPYLAAVRSGWRCVCRRRGCPAPKFVRRRLTTACGKDKDPRAAINS